MKDILFLTAWMLFITVACNSSKSASSTSNTRTDSLGQLENLNPSVDLADHLRRIPGLSISGQGSSAKASIRGFSSFNTDTEPLFVINGTPVNGGLGFVSSIVPVADIQSIRVLKTASETSTYGLRGSNGVIEITLKS